jgi:beta-glucosidase
VLKKGGVINVTIDVTNTGKRPGDEIVQLYVTHVSSKIERPLEELKGFQRISIQPGETKTIRLPLKAQDLAYWDESAHRFVVENDTVQIKIGPSSDNIQQEKTISVRN